MKRWVCVAGALLAIVLLGDQSSPGMDVGMLKPVQIVVVKKVGENILVQTDTEDQGIGKDLPAAVETMKASASGEIFLETADHLLVEPACMDVLADAIQLLRPACTLCLIEGEPNMDTLGDFLKLHAPQVTLTEYRAGISDLQYLKCDEGRMCIEP